MIEQALLLIIDARVTMVATALVLAMAQGPRSHHTEFLVA